MSLYLNNLNKNLEFYFEKDEKTEAIKVYGSVEKPQQWQVFLYTSNLTEKSSSMTKSKVGDIVWLCLSEQQVCLSAILRTDPFIMYFEQNSKKNSLEKLSEGKTLEISHFSTKSEKKDEICEEDFSNVDLQFIKLNLFEKMANDQKSAIHSLWKIEAANNFEYGFLKWKTPYRFRHFVTGKYLRLPINLRIGKENENKVKFHLIFD